MGLPGLRGPPGTKVSHIFTTSYTNDVYVRKETVFLILFLLYSSCIFSGFAWLQRRQGQFRLTSHSACFFKTIIIIILSQILIFLSVHFLKGGYGEPGAAGPKGDKVGREISFSLLCCPPLYSPFMLGYEHFSSCCYNGLNQWSGRENY